MFRLTITIMKKIAKSKKLRNDIILTASILIVAASVFFIISLMSADGGYVEVKKDGEIIASYPLSENIEVEIGDEKEYNLLIIENGKAYMKDASCPDKLCMHQGYVSQNGETLVCLPNKTTVTVVSDKASDTDFVS